MHYDQSWMGFGMVGGLEAGAISALAALLLYLVVHALGRRHGWSPVRQLSIAFLLAVFFTASGDSWDLLYFNYGQLQSIELLKAKLAQLHDPDNIGLRVTCELIGALVGDVVGWLVTGGNWRGLLRGE